MRSRRPARLALIIVPIILLALMAITPYMLLAQSGSSSGADAQVSSLFSSVILSASAGQYTITNNPDGPVLTNWHPAVSTNNTLEKISVDYADPDGVARFNDVYRQNWPQMWFDGVEVSECAAQTGFVTSTATTIAWGHRVILWGGNPVSCRSIPGSELQPMTDGTHTVKVTVKDKLYYSGGVEHPERANTIEWTFSIDNSPPTITPSAICGTTVDTASPTIGFGYSDTSDIDVASVKMYMDDIPVETAYATASEAVYTPSGLSDGVHRVRLDVKDKGGNPATSTCTFTVNTQPPTIDTLLPADGSTIDNPSPMILATWSDIGAGVDQYTAHLEFDGSDVTSNAVLAEYGLSYQAGSLSLGAHTVTISVRDKAGLLSATRSSTFIYTNDVQPPVVDSLTPANGSTIGTASPLIQAAWHDAGAAGIDQYTAHLELDGSDVSAGAAVTQYGLSYQASGLAPGVHTVSVYIKDKGGLQSATVISSFTYAIVDTVPPVIDILIPSDGSAIDTADTLVQVTWSDAGTGVDQSTAHLELDGSDVSAGAAVTQYGLSYQASGLTAGTHTVTVFVKDKAGLQSTTRSSSFTYAPYNPDGPSFSNWMPDGATNDQYDPIRINYSDPDGIAPDGTVNGPRMWFDGYEVTGCYDVGVTFNPGGVSGISWNHRTVTERGPGCITLAAPIVPMADGEHTARVIVTDTKGNMNSKVWTFMVDHTPPTITPSSLCGSVTESATPAISFAYADQYGMDPSTAAMKLDGAAVAVYAGAAETVYMSGPLSDGEHTAVFEIEDVAGNLSTSTCTFTVDTLAPVITGVAPLDGSRIGIADPLIDIAWNDAGAGIDQYTAHLELDGSDVTGGASVTASGMKYQAGGLAVGDHTVTVSVKDKTGKPVSASYGFRYSLPISYYAPWYDSKAANGMNGNWIMISNQESTQAVVDVYIGSEQMAGPDGGHWNIAGGGRAEPAFSNKMAGPVRVVSTNGTELLVSQRVLYKSSFNEVPAVRENELDSEYRFTWYDSKQANGMSGNWILIGNVEASRSATVDVYIGNSSVPIYTGTIEPGGIVTPGTSAGMPQFTNLMDGPVKVKSRGGEKLIVSQRVLYKDAFSEVMGTPLSKLDDEYYFTWYDWKSAGMNGNYILVSNESASVNAYVDIEIGGEKMNGPNGGQWRIAPGSRVTPFFLGSMDGPVKVSCPGCAADGVKIMASQRVIYKNSFEEVQGLSPNDMGDSAVFTWYDWQSPQMRGDWVLIGNQDAAVDAYMQVYIGSSGAPMAMSDGGPSGFTAVKGGGITTPFFTGVMGGPVKAACSTCAPGQKLIISQRVLYLDSFNEVVGRPPVK